MDKEWERGAKIVLCNEKKLIKTKVRYKEYGDTTNKP
jgi:hypothetical protein